MPLANVKLDDKYTLEDGRVFLTGLQALVRLPMMQRQRDAHQGLNTAGFISGYRGSPIGGYDAALWQAKPFLERNHIRFKAGLNEDQAATAVWGTQQVNLFPGGKYDGVFGIWYGKGPGVDRSGDAIKHLNYDGTSPHGGVLLIAGDDHGAKSSTLPHQSEQAFMAANVPVINPAGVQEYIDYGLLGFALSRYSGCAIGFKAVGDTIESTASISIDPQRISISDEIDFDMPEGGVNIRYPFSPIEKEDLMLKYKLPAAMAFARANRFDRIVIDSPKPRLGIAAAGKAYLDVRQAMDELGLTPQKASDLGIRLYKIALAWPLEPQGVLDFADGLEEILVVEEKRGVIQEQLQALLYNRPQAPRVIIGKRDEEGRVLFPEHGEISPGKVAAALAGRIKRYADLPEFEQRLARIEEIEREALGSPPQLIRTPYFCSGCPHNTSTKLPDGSRAMAGIGCHGMALWMPDRSTATITHMGAEGVNWIGQEPFTETDHIFQNLGDGTYYHSGILAIRAAIDAGVNITYKILFNDAVAMTGGQPVIHEGQITPMAIAAQVHAEGVKKLVIVSDEPDKYPVGTHWPPGTTVHHRDELDQLQRDLRVIKGTTVLIYDQTCAAEKRRRRKRGLFPDPPKRAFINDRVCEGCGDCSTASNCVSVLPLDTAWGRKRQIDQSNCNKDFSCIKGFCPSFVTVNGGQVRKARSQHAGDSSSDLFADLPEPQIPSAGEPYGILLTGIGGTGVVTVGALLGMASHLEGKGVSVLDMAGLAQKNGAVTSHIRIADNPEDLHAVKISTGGSKLILGCDIVVATSPEVTSTINHGVTGVVANSHVVPTVGFLQDQGMDFAAQGMIDKLSAAVGPEHAHFVNATKLAAALLGDSIAANTFMLGFAYQKGWLPLSAEALTTAIEINGVAVEANQRAFAWGRLAAHDAAAVEQVAAPLMPQESETSDREVNLEERTSRHIAELTEYQDAAYAERYRVLVAFAARAEREQASGMEGFTAAVADNMFKLMAYKDEFEVARLYTSGEFLEKLNRQFEGDFSLSFHMAPPLLSKRDENGRLIKREFGPWMMPVLKFIAGMRRFRGTALDIFGLTAERKMERRLIGDYEQVIMNVCTSLNHDNYPLAQRIAEYPEKIKGFGHIKEANVVVADIFRDELLDTFRQPMEKPSAAE
jgi:indolepyruvate ferredoxin oxidoreductase